MWKPAGMECLEAVVRIFLKDNSPWEEEVEGGRKIVVLSLLNIFPN